MQSDADEDLIQRERTWRTMQIAISCINNIAAYKANWQKIDGVDKLIVDRHFWVLMNGNFLNVAVLDWCKLFAESNGKHHWSCSFKNEWKEQLFARMAMSQSKFKKELGLVNEYRSKFVAHLDDPIAMNYPNTNFMLDSVSYLHDCLKTNFETKRFFVGYYKFAEELYASRIEAAIDEVRFASASKDEFIPHKIQLAD